MKAVDMDNLNSEHYKTHNKENSFLFHGDSGSKSTT